MNYSTIEGCIRQSTQNKIMDTQNNQYVVLKNGEPMNIKGTLEQIIRHVRLLEQGLNRHLQHSPYTIGKTDAN